MIRDSCQDGMLKDEDRDVGNLQTGCLDSPEGARKRPFLFGAAAATGFRAVAAMATSRGASGPGAGAPPLAPATAGSVSPRTNFSTDSP